MTATPAAPPATLTPARKRLIRQAFARYGPQGAPQRLWVMPSFHDVSRWQVRTWAKELGLIERGPNVLVGPTPAIPAITQANEPATGEWYSALAIAKGLGIGVERVYGWKAFGWLHGGPLYTAEDIRAFVRGHPLEVIHPLMRGSLWPDEIEACLLWLVSVLTDGTEDPHGRCE